MRTRSKSGGLAFVVAIVALMSLGMNDAAAQDQYIAEVKMFGGNFAPRGYAFCDGQLLQIASNTAFFSLVGTMYGGDGRTTLGVPDLRGRAPMHVGNGPGLAPSGNQGAKRGSVNATLSAANLPSHTHTANLRAHVAAKATQDVPDGTSVLGRYPRKRQYSSAAPDVSLSADGIQVGATGGGQAFSIMQPYIVVNYIIATQGVYPSRN